MSQRMTFAPACAKAVAIPSPMPDAAPVTNAAFPASSFTRVLPLASEHPRPKGQVSRTPYDSVFERLGSVLDVRSWGTKQTFHHKPRMSALEGKADVVQ